MARLYFTKNFNGFTSEECAEIRIIARKNLEKRLATRASKRPSVKK